MKTVLSISFAVLVLINIVLLLTLNVTKEKNKELTFLYSVSKKKLESIILESAFETHKVQLNLENRKLFSGVRLFNVDGEKTNTGSLFSSKIIKLVIVVSNNTCTDCLKSFFTLLKHKVLIQTMDDILILTQDKNNFVIKNLHLGKNRNVYRFTGSLFEKGVIFPVHSSFMFTTDSTLNCSNVFFINQQNTDLFESYLNSVQRFLHGI